VEDHKGVPASGLDTTVLQRRCLDVSFHKRRSETKYRKKLRSEMTNEMSEFEVMTSLPAFAYISNIVEESSKKDNKNISVEEYPV
jgi:hypothetical protein